MYQTVYLMWCVMTKKKINAYLDPIPFGTDRVTHCRKIVLTHLRSPDTLIMFLFLPKIGPMYSNWIESVEGFKILDAY